MQGNNGNRGFAAMESGRQREIARKGGKAAHQKGTAHQFTADEARAAGKKGGEAVSANRGHMSQIGRIGGKKSAGRRRQSSKSTLQLPQNPPSMLSADESEEELGRQEVRAATA
jgi:general stress protein YciG